MVDRASTARTNSVSPNAPGRYISFSDRASKKIQGSVRLDYSLWVENEVSPIWIAGWKEEHPFIREIFKQVAASDGLSIEENKLYVMLPLDVGSGQEFSEIVDCAVERIEKVLQLIGENPPDS